MHSSVILWFAVMGLGPADDGPAADGSASTSVSLGGAAAEGGAAADGGKKAKKSNESKRRGDRADEKWIRRWAPERNTAEIGVFGGVMFPHPRLELFEPSFDLPEQGFVPLRRFAPEVGGRVGYYFLRVLGVEGEGGVMFGRTTTDQGALLWGVRGQLVGQLPWWSVTPFVLAGVSGLGVSSDRAAVGNDVDLGFHFGAGVKVAINRYVGLRLDVRDNLTARRGVGQSVIHTPEVLLGLTLTLGRKKSEPAGPIDTDGDGILDPDDRCVDVPGVAEHQGCPIPDTDGDGILDPDDQCPEEPETSNGYEDDDGCPDEVPEQVKTFTGVIEGIYFDTAKATIKPASRRKLDEVVDVLKNYPKLRLEISGHTDDRGDDASNLQLSLDRADAVKKYLTDAGIEGSRIQTRGAGEAEPIESNDTKKGRAKNRRIEFELLGR